MTNQPIIVFDSGIGGMSIYRPLKAALPEENSIYIADTSNFPYGSKSADWIKNRFIELAKQFDSLSPKLVVLACNTATTNIISYLRETLSCPIVGVEPVIKPLSQYGSSLALMTESTANSVATAKLLEVYGANVHVYTPKGLPTAIEYHDLDQVKKSIHEIKEIVQKENIQAVGLSCTHYPLILPMLQAAMPEVVFIDPSEAVVKEVVRVLNLDHL
jgi:glutamate racemase